MKNLVRSVAFALLVTTSVSAFAGRGGANPPPIPSKASMLVNVMLAVLGY
jgi:hypothetical protein